MSGVRVHGKGRLRVNRLDGKSLEFMEDEDFCMFLPSLALLAQGCHNGHAHFADKDDLTTKRDDIRRHGV
jgi:hypothetical protein